MEALIATGQGRVVHGEVEERSRAETQMRKSHPGRGVLEVRGAAVARVADVEDAEAGGGSCRSVY
jgi:hypothetical protein